MYIYATLGSRSLYIPLFLSHEGVFTGAVLPCRIVDDGVVIGVPANLYGAKVARD